MNELFKGDKPHHPYMRLLTSRSCATFTSFFCGTCSVSLEIECSRLASVAKWALAKQRMRTSRNQNTFERSTLFPRGRPPSTYTKVSFLFLHLLGNLFLLLQKKTSVASNLLFGSRKWSKGQLRLQSLMDFLKQELQLQLDPAMPRQLDPDVADTQQIWEEISLKHPEKRPRARETSFSELFYFCSKMLAVKCPKKEFDTLIHLWMINIQLFHVEMQKWLALDLADFLIWWRIVRSKVWLNLDEFFRTPIGL